MAIWSDYATPWDERTDQPHVLPRSLRRPFRPYQLRAAIAREAWLMAQAPLLFARSWRLIRRPPSLRLTPRELFGVGILPAAAPWSETAAALRALGVRQVQLRLDPRHDWRLAARWAQLATAAGYQVLLTVVQTRAQLLDPAATRRWLAAVLALLPATGISALQVGHASNRSKWGLLHPGEYRRWSAVVASVLRAARPEPLLGGSIIDYDPHYLAQALWPPGGVAWDGVANALYVDRYGGPFDCGQLGMALRGKVATTRAVQELAPRAGQQLWLTEFNWPLAGTGPYSPTWSKHGDPYAVDEGVAAAHSLAYVELIRQQGIAERVFFWQLVAPGYGLVDPRGGSMRRRPAFHALAQWLAQG